MKIKIGIVIATGKPFFVDVEKLIYGRLGIYSSSGGGKSAAARLYSELIPDEIQKIILDKNGEFNSLREKFDFVLAGPDGDIPAVVATAGKLALKIMELGSNLISDLSDLKPEEKHDYVRNFTRAMMDAPKALWRKKIFIVDEAHKFCPENGEGVSSAKEPLIESAEDGRKREIGTTLLTQRVVKLDKSAMAELQNKMVGLTNTPDDRARAAKELGFKDKDQIFSLGKLEPGQFYCLGPAFGKEIVLVQLDMPKTSHERKKARGRAPAPTSKVKAVLSKLKDLPQEVKKEAETMASLRVKIVETEKNLKEALKQAGKVGPVPVDVTLKEKIKKEAQAAFLQENLKSWTKISEDFSKRFKEFESLVQTEIRKIKEPPKVIKNFPISKTKEMKPSELVRYTPPSPVFFPPNDGTQEIKLNKTQKDVLKFLAARPGKSFSMAQVAAMCVVANSGSFSTYVSALASQGFIKRASGMLEIANLEGAIQILGADYSEPSRDLNEWISKLNPTQKKVFEFLRERQEEAFSLGDLAATVGVQNSGSFSTYISGMSTLGLVVRERGMVRFNKEILDL